MAPQFRLRLRRLNLTSLPMLIEWSFTHVKFAVAASNQIGLVTTDPPRSILSFWPLRPSTVSVPLVNATKFFAKVITSNKASQGYVQTVPRTVCAPILQSCVSSGLTMRANQSTVQ